MSGKFTALESNPEMFTSFARSLGVKSPARFVDVWSFDEETLGCFPQPIVAVCVLYPSGLDAKRRDVSQVDKGDGSNCLYIKQRLHEVGNACGTLALMHAIGNNTSRLEFSHSSPLLEFSAAHHGQNAEHLADAINRAQFLREASETVASSGQTETPQVNDHVDSHFICFVIGRNGHLVELDGMKPGPVDHGKLGSEADFFPQTMRVVREEMVARTEDVNFSVLALTTSLEDD
ncbi:hypothetical protein BASA81_007392 [Batrachochytrium salamandrivorans]|nr:hypothetical protein BASA81_007392 [Batrachochytrium salamandrivorans]